MRDYPFTFSKEDKADRFAFILDQSGLSYLRPDLLNFIVYGILPEMAKMLKGFA